MNIYDAAKILSLSGSVTPELIKTAFREACKKYHPDINPAGEEMMKVVNAAYEVLKNHSGEIKEEQADYGEEFNTALNSILALDGLNIEIMGVWIWVTGDTITHKNHLKEAGFKWASKKKAWHFRPANYRSSSRGQTPLEEIRAKYGSEKPNGSGFHRVGNYANA